MEQLDVSLCYFFSFWLLNQLFHRGRWTASHYHPASHERDVGIGPQDLRSHRLPGLAWQLVHRRPGLLSYFPFPCKSFENFKDCLNGESVGEWNKGWERREPERGRNKGAWDLLGLRFLQREHWVLGLSPKGKGALGFFGSWARRGWFRLGKAKSG